LVGRFNSFNRVFNILNIHAALQFVFPPLRISGCKGERAKILAFGGGFWLILRLRHLFFYTRVL